MNAASQTRERPTGAAWARPAPKEWVQSDLGFGVLQIVGVLAWIAQLVLDMGVDNVASASIILFFSTLTFQFLRISRSFKEQPFSSLAVLGLCMTTQWGAMVAQSGALTPVADNLRTPVKTFSLLGGYQMMAIAALWFTARFGGTVGARRAISRWALQPVGIFENARPVNLWCLGFIGFAAILVEALLHGEGGIGGRVVLYFRFLAWAPFVIPIIARRDPGYCNLPRQTTALGVYSLSVIGLGMAVNGRAVMFIGVMTVGMQALMLMLGSDDRVRRTQLWKAIPALMIAALGVGYASDLATATVIVRDQRKSANPIEMIQLTVMTLFDRAAIETFKDGLDVNSKLDSYDEYYISNQVVTRLVETKYHDNMFFLAEHLAPKEIELLRQNTIDTMWATLPEPVLRVLGISLDKDGLSYSVGDLFDYLRYGSEVGSFKIGSIFAHGQALFGTWFFGVYFLMCAAIFTVLDSFAIREAGVGMRYAPVALLSAYGLFFNTISGDSIMVVVSALLRGTAQTVLVYALALAATRVVFPLRKPVTGVTLPAMRPMWRDR